MGTNSESVGLLQSRELGSQASAVIYLTRPWAQLETTWP